MALVPAMSFRQNRSEVVQILFRGTLPLLLIVTLLLQSGCSRRYSDMPAYLPFSLGEYDNESVGRFKTSYLAQQIDEYYRGTNPGPIGVTSFVNVDDLYSSSPFGRLCGEQLMSELSMRGYDVVELRQADALQFVTYGGEFALSREARRVRPARDLGGIIVGTYVVSPVRVYLNSRLIDPSTSLVLSAGSVEMSKTKELARLLRGSSMPTVLERIPVRHLALDGYTPRSMRDSMFDMEESEPAPEARMPEVPKGAKAPALINKLREVK